MARLSVLVAAVVTFIGLTAPSARSADTPELSGVYRCDGANPDGSPYRGIVEIAKNHDTFHVRWSFPDGRSAFGIGFVRSNSLSVSYFGGGVAGLAIYKIESGKLVGEWAVAGADGTVYTETLTKVADDHHNSDNDERRRPRSQPERKPVKPTGPVIKS